MKIPAFFDQAPTITVLDPLACFLGAAEEGIIEYRYLLIALLFIRDIRRERSSERLEEHLDLTATAVKEIRADLIPPDAILIGPDRIRAESEDFSRHAHGEMIWFHVCLLMFRPQFLFDVLLRPAIENPRVTSIQFVLDKKQKDLWEKEVVPKMNACSGSGKVKEPCWTTINENVSFVLSNIHSDSTECLLSFWGEPFMAYSTERKVPRYIFYVRAHSELIGRLVELERNYRFVTTD